MDNECISCHGWKRQDEVFCRHCSNRHHDLAAFGANAILFTVAACVLLLLAAGMVANIACKP